MAASAPACSFPSAASHYDWTGLAEARRALLRYLTQRCRDLHEAEDVTHEALVRAARYRSRQRDPQRFFSWLLHIALNVHRDHVRRAGRAAYVPLDELDVDALPAYDADAAWAAESTLTVGGREVEESEVQLALQRSWQDLAALDRSVLRSFYGDEASTEAVARACSLPRATVKVRLYRARQRLERRILVHLTAAAVARVGRARGAVSPDVPANFFDDFGEKALHSASRSS